MGEETKAEETAPCCAVEAPKWLADELVGKKVNCWTHHQKEGCLQGVVKAWDEQMFKLVTSEGRIYMISWNAGPLFQILEF